ncbi:MAG: hypothetical protein ACI89L_002280 [Phycisphaerales bacterium]|jgi:hypothetical protein
MPLRVLRFETTPNPNAVKVLVEPAPVGGIRSYFKAEQAGQDPLGTALFQIEGVTTVLIHEKFVSVNKRPEKTWGPIKKAVRAALESSD